MRGRADAEEEARGTNGREEAEEGEDVVMRLRSWRAMMGLGLSMVLLSCSGSQKPEVSEEFKKNIEAMEQRGREQMLGALDQQIQPIGTREPPGAVHLLAPGEPIWLQSGKSRALQVPNRITRVSLGDPEIAGIVVLGSQSIMINAKPLPPLERRDERAISVGRTGTVLGRTLTPEPRIFETTLVIWGPSEEPDIHTLIVADFLDDQVLLEVTVAEVNRSALEDHGIDFRVVQDKLIAAGFMMGGIPVPSTIPPSGGGLLPLGIFGGDRPTYAFIFPDENVSVLLKLLETEGLATILAQPKVLAMSGQIAVFQVGGEIPIRISSGFAADIEFKPFGTLVNFIPRVTEEGDIFLTVTPEVSEPDFTQTVEGIPTFRTRRASTTAKLREGQTLILGGLLQRITLEAEQGVPYLKDIPYLGYAFSTTHYETEVRELIVTVRPHLVTPIPAGEQVYNPTDRGPLTNEEVRTQREPAETTRPRLPLLP